MNSLTQLEIVGGVFSLIPTSLLYGLMPLCPGMK